MSFTIPCLHEREGVPHTTRVDDYHPLTRDETRNLLELAHKYYSRRDLRLFSDIQCRLAQAVPGAKCPSEIDGWTARRTALLDELFVHTGDFEVSEQLVDLFRWIQTDHRITDGDEPHLRERKVEQPTKDN